MKHPKIMSNDKIILEKEINDCCECVFLNDEFGYCPEIKRTIAFEEVGTILVDCPLEDKVD